MPAEFDKVASNGHGVDPRYVPQTPLETQRELVVPAGRVRLTFNVIIEGLLPEGANREQSAQPVEPPTPQGDHRLAGINGREGATPLVISEIPSPNGRAPSTPIVRRETPSIDQLDAIYGPTGFGDQFSMEIHRQLLLLALGTLSGSNRVYDYWKRIGSKKKGTGDIFVFHDNEKYPHLWDIREHTAFSPLYDGAVRPWKNLAERIVYPVVVGYYSPLIARALYVLPTVRINLRGLDHTLPLDALRETATGCAKDILGPGVDPANFVLNPGDYNPRSNRKGLDLLYPVPSLPEGRSVLSRMIVGVHRAQCHESAWEIIRKALPPFFPLPMRDFWESVKEEWESVKKEERFDLL